MTFEKKCLFTGIKCNFKINFCNFLVERKFKTKFSKNFTKVSDVFLWAIDRCQTEFRQVLNLKGWFTIAQFMLGVSVPMMMALTIIYCFKWAFTINLPNTINQKLKKITATYLQDLLVIPFSSYKIFAVGCFIKWDLIAVQGYYPMNSYRLRLLDNPVI